MSRRILENRVGRAIALAAMFAYSAIGVLGYGLHSVSHCEHTACHSHGDHDGDHDHGPSVASSCDDCSICSFLAQAQTDAAPIVTIEGSQPLAAAPAEAAPLTPTVFADSPHARGPPVA